MHPESGEQAAVDCGRVREMLLEIGSGGEAALAESLQRHLDECPACSREFRSVETLVRLARRALHTPVPEEVCRHLDQVLFGEGDHGG